MIILASKSWLKQKILDLSEFEYLAVEANIDERAVEAEYSDKSDQEVSEQIALAKAKKVSEQYPNDVVIGADTFAVMPDGSRMSKPTSNADAINKSLAQSGKTIQIFTGVAIIKGDQEFVDHSSTKVSYVDFDKALINKLFADDDGTIRNAGLGFFIDAPGFSLVKSFVGSYTGAMGLPMEIIRPVIEQLESL